jgi:hypothetical protein
MWECQSDEPPNQDKLLGTSLNMVSLLYPNQSNIYNYIWKCNSNTCVRMHIALKQGQIPFMLYKTIVIILIRIGRIESCIYQLDPICVLFAVLSSFVDVYINRKDGIAE